MLIYFIWSFSFRVYLSNKYLSCVYKANYPEAGQKAKKETKTTELFQ